MNIKRIIVSVTTIVFLVLGGIFINNANKEHIGGNVLNLPILPEELSPQHAILPQWAANGLLIQLLYRTLFLVDTATDDYIPNLVKDYTVSDDNLVYTFNLKDGLLWTNNTPITGFDIKANIDGALRSHKVPFHFDEFFQKIKKMEASEKSITIVLHTSHAYTLQVLSQYIILPKEAIENENLDLFYTSKFWESPITSGRYQISTITDDKIELIQNPYYNGDKAKIEKIVLHKDDLKFDMHMTGNVTEMIQYRALRGYTEIKIPSQTYRYIVFNVQGDDGNTNEAMQDLALRQAIVQSIDRVRLLKDVYHNIGAIQLANRFLNPDEIPAFDARVVRENVAKLDYDLSRPLRLAYYFDDNVTPYLAQRLARDFEDVGFKVEIQKGESLALLLKDRNFDILLHESTTMNPIDRMLEYGSSSPFSAITGTNGEFDYLLAQIRENHSEERYTKIEADLYSQTAAKMLRYPLVTLNQAIYVNTERLSIPKDIKFENPLMVFDFKFNEWEILKK